VKILFCLVPELAEVQTKKIETQSLVAFRGTSKSSEKYNLFPRTNYTIIRSVLDSARTDKEAVIF
jgi:hypothetical protein